MRTWIAVGVVCLALGNASAVSAQESEVETERQDDAAPASVEMSLSISPTFLLSVLQLGSAPSLGGFLQPVLDVSFALDARLLIALGVMLSATEAGGGSSVRASVPVSLLWYLDTPRVGRVMPMLRVGASVGYAQYDGGESYEVGALVRGGITWLADRCIGIRAELGLRGGIAIDGDAGYGGLGLDALVGVVLRV